MRAVSPDPNSSAPLSSWRKPSDPSPASVLGSPLRGSFPFLPSAKRHRPHSPPGSPADTGAPHSRHFPGEIMTDLQTGLDGQPYNPSAGSLDPRGASRLAAFRRHHRRPSSD